MDIFQEWIQGNPFYQYHTVDLVGKKIHIYFDGCGCGCDEYLSHSTWSIDQEGYAVSPSGEKFILEEEKN